MVKKLIHIGPQKTGTTYLQRNYFPGIPNWSYLKKGYSTLGTDDFQSTILISTEALAGLPWNEAWKSGIINEYRYINSFKKAINNLKLLHPDARIIIVLRKHGDWLISLYKQYVIEGGVLEFNKFYEENGVINDKDLNYTERIGFLRKKFDEVDILSFEQFKVEGNEYYNRYFTFLGYGKSSLKSNQKTNPGISGKKLELLRKINRFYPKLPKNIQNVLKKNKIEPRNILRARIKFWNPVENEELKQAKFQVNKKFKSDWENIQNLFWSENSSLEKKAK